MVVMASPATQLIVFWDITPAPGGCPFAQRVWLALEELKLPYDHKLADPANKPEDFTDLYKAITQTNDSAKVPTIIDGSVQLTESAIVVEYLSAKYGDGNSLSPAGPEELGKVKLFVELFTGKFQVPFFKALGARDDKELLQAAQSLETGLEVLDRFIAASGVDASPGYFLGSRYSIAETLTTPFVRMAMVLLPHYKKVDVQKIAERKGLKRILPWIQASMNRESNKRTGLPNDLMIEANKQFVKADVSPGFGFPTRSCSAELAHTIYKEQQLQLGIE